MNGIPVYPHLKNGERPYLAVPKPGFWDPFFGAFSPVLYSPVPYYRLSKSKSTPQTLFIILFL